MPVPQTAEVTCHVSTTIPETLQPLKVCEEQLDDINVGQRSEDSTVMSLLRDTDSGSANACPCEPVNCSPPHSGVFYGSMACMRATASSALNLLLCILPTNVKADSSHHTR
ncbi:hypothetical protein MRX96_015515 [Rhipicephalus microplus]